MYKTGSKIVLGLGSNCTTEFVIGFTLGRRSNRLKRAELVFV